MPWRADFRLITSTRSSRKPARGIPSLSQRRARHPRTSLKPSNILSFGTPSRQDRSKPYDAGQAGSLRSFKWGTDSGEEFVALEPRLQLVSEQSYNVEMRKHTLRDKLFAATVGKNANNCLAIFAW